MTYIIFDIETVVDRDLVEKAEGMSFDEYFDRLREKTGSPDPFVHWIYHRPVALVGVHLDNQRATPFVYAEPEDIASRWWDAYSKARPTGKPLVLVTWNGWRFDLPVLEAHGIARKASLGRYLTYPGDEKSWEDPRGRYSGHHLDLCSILACNGSAPAPSLSAAATLFGYPGKFGTTGGDAAALYEAGDIDAIVSYCATDVLSTLGVFLAMETVKGWRCGERMWRDLEKKLVFLAADPEPIEQWFELFWDGRREEWLKEEAFTQD